MVRATKVLKHEFPCDNVKKRHMVCDMEAHSNQVINGLRSETMLLHETLAGDSRLAPVFEEYLICSVYLDELEQEHKPETTTLRSVVRTQIKSIRRRIMATAGATYPKLDEDTVGRAAALIFARQPIGREYYLAKLPA